ncbi:hypothetical protein ZWY2020_030486 [Hordeum vulgare]|nr:hypothetical protein ZWY2020_030486 [Hordeum vulgare]
MMESGFVFPILSPVVIAEQLSQYGIAPVANLRPENIANPQPDLLPGVLARFFDSFVDAPEHHAEAIRALHLYIKSQAFLDSIKFKDFTLADFTRPTPDRVVVVLSALVNFLLYREEKVTLLQPIVSETPDYHERTLELKARIAQLQKEITDHELAAQMEEPMAQQLEADVNALQQKVQVYNKQQLNLRAKAAAINDKKEEIHRKITQADFELTKHAQENSRLMSKLVKSPEKVKRVLEEKKSARAKLKESEKIAMQNDQEKSQHSKVQHVHEQLVAAKTVEKEVKAQIHEMEERLKGKVEERNQITADENQKLGALSSEIEGKLCLELREKKVEAMIAKVMFFILNILLVELKILFDRWINGRAVSEVAPLLYACIPKRRRKSRTVADGLQGNRWASDIHGTIGLPEIGEYLCLWHLVSQTTLSDEPDSVRWKWTTNAASVKTASMAEQQKSRAEFDNIVKEYNAYMDSFNPFLEQVEEAVR